MYIVFPQGLALSGRIGALNYFECSAMTGKGMEVIAKEAIRVVEAIRNPPPPPYKSCVIQ